MIDLKRFTSAEAPRKAHPDRLINDIVQSLAVYVFPRPADFTGIVGHCDGRDYVFIGGNARYPSAAELREAAHGACTLATARGYDKDNGFDTDNFDLILTVNRQSDELTQNARRSRVGDSRVVRGFACNETPERLPRVVVAAERIADKLDELKPKLPYLRPDGKVQVTARNGTYLVTAHVQHDPGVPARKLEQDIAEHAVFPVLGDAFTLYVKPFVEGGPRADAGTSNVKLCAYGEQLPHGGGGPWGKDPTKPELFAFLEARRLATETVRNGAPACEIELAYSLGETTPIITDVTANANPVHYHKGQGRIVQELWLTDPDVLSELSTRRLIGDLYFPWER